MSTVHTICQILLGTGHHSEATRDLKGLRVEDQLGDFDFITTPICTAVWFSMAAHSAANIWKWRRQIRDKFRFRFYLVGWWKERNVRKPARLSFFVVVGGRGSVVDEVLSYGLGSD